MRTTIDIDDDLMHELKNQAGEENLSLKDTVNRAIRQGLNSKASARSKVVYRCPVFSMGSPKTFNLDRALHIAADLESEEISRKLKLRK